MRAARKQFWLAILLAWLGTLGGVFADELPAIPAPAKPAALPVATLQRDTPVDFEKEILPALKNNCLACHNTTKAKAGLNLETPQFMLKGGDSGPAVMPGKSGESLLFKAAAHLDSELIMPPKDNKVNASHFTPEQLGLLKLWIDQGAKGDVRAVAAVNWLEKPPSLDPILALALTQDGQFAACGRGNRIDIYHVPSGQLAARLTDPKLVSGGVTNAAHRDLVNALAFNPDGTLLASGGFREVKLWRRPRDVQKPLPAATNIAALFAAASDQKYESKVIDEFKRDHAVIALTVSPDGRRFASIETNGLAKLWNASNGVVVAELKGDRYAYEAVAEMERALVVAKSDVEFRTKSRESAEAEQKKQTERVAKATETNSVTEKVFAEKEKAFKEAEKTKAGAEKALADLLAEIDKVTKGFEAADKSAREAGDKAKAASNKAAQSQLAAERAVLSRSEAEKIAAEAMSVAAKTKAAVSNADTAKEIATRIAEESAAVAEKSRAFADAVAADAEMKTKLAAEARSAAEKAIEEVASLAFAAGQLKPGYDKTLAEAPEKRKGATNQIDSTTKALTSAQAELKKAETRKSVTNHELELAQAAQKRAADRLAEAKSALSEVETARKETEAAVDRTKKIATAAELPIRALAFSAEGATLATAGDDGYVHTWSAETGAAFDVFGRSLSASNKTTIVLNVGFLDNQTVAVSDGQQAVAWDLNPGWTLERTIGTGDMASPLTDRVNAVRFSPDGRTLATGSGEPTRSGEIKLWTVADGSLLREFTNVHSDAVLSLDFSPDEKYIASSSADRFVRVTELASGKILKAFEGHTSYVLGVAWKRDSRTLASAGADNVIKVWDFVTGERRKNIDGASKEVTSISFLGASGEAVATSGDGQVRLVRENGDKVRSFEGANDFMNCAAATPDGRIVVAGGQDGVMRVWNGSDGKPVASFFPAQGR